MGMPQAGAREQCEEGVAEMSCYGMTAAPHSIAQLRGCCRQVRSEE